MPFAPKETTSGGNALKFYSSIRLDVRRIATIKKNGTPIGNKVAVKVVKNKIAPPFKKVEVDIIFGSGISHYLDLLDVAIKLKVVKQAGAWFTFNKKNLAQGRDNCVTVLKDNPDLLQEIKDSVYKVITENSVTLF